MPQRSLAGRRTKMGRIVAEFRTGKASEADAIARVGNEAFSDVIPRFHNLGKTQELQGTFYEIDFGNQLALKDELFEIAGDVDSLNAEIEARWSLLEGAYTIQSGDFELANSMRDN